jgi:hypothetical protein
VALSHKDKVRLLIAGIAAVAAIAAAATGELLSNSGNNSNITQVGHGNNACANDSHCTQAR